MEIRIHRELPPGRYRLEEVHPQIRSFGVLKEIFPDEAEREKVLAELDVYVVDEPRQMYVDNNDGSIVIGHGHLSHFSQEIIHLDIVHELCHVRQHLQGRDLYDRRHAYVDRPTEIEAYELTVREARRIGFTEEAILDYLRVPWITAEEHRRLAVRLGVGLGRPGGEAVNLD